MPSKPSAWAAIVLTASLAALGLGAYVLLRGSDVAQPTAPPAVLAAPDPSHAEPALPPQAIVREAAGPVIWHAWRRDGSVVYATRAPDAVWVTDGAASRRLSTFTPTHGPPALSGDSEAVAFSLGSAVQLVNLDTGRSVKVQTGGEILSLAWRPEPRELAYSVGNAIYLVAADGSNRRLLRRVRSYHWSDEDWLPCHRIDTLRWSANGRSLGYLAWVCPDPEDEPHWRSPRFVLLDVASKSVLHYEDGYAESDSVFAVSPDGQHYTIGGHCGSPDSTVYIDNEAVAGGGSASVCPHAAWSPSGRLVAWEGGWNAQPFSIDVGVYEGVGSGSFNPTPDGWPEFEWSPDGQAFVYHYRKFDRKAAQPRLVASEARLVRVSDLMKFDAGKSWSALVRTWPIQWEVVPHLILARDFRGTDLAWSPDGKKVSWLDGKQIWSVSLPSSATP